MKLVIGLLLLSCLAGALARLTVRIEGSRERWRFVLRYAGLAIVDTAREAGLSKTKRQTRKQRRRKRSLPIGRLIELAPEFTRALARGARFLLKHSRLDKLAVRGSLAGSDPAVTGSLFALLSAVAGALGSFMPGIELAIVPNFMSRSTELTFEAEASARTVTLLVFPIVVFLRLPIKKLVWFAFACARR